jgi:hypothetical protein
MCCESNRCGGIDLVFGGVEAGAGDGGGGESRSRVMCNTLKFHHF